ALRRRLRWRRTYEPVGYRGARGQRAARSACGRRIADRRRQRELVGIGRRVVVRGSTRPGEAPETPERLARLWLSGGRPGWVRRHRARARSVRLPPRLELVGMSALIRARDATVEGVLAGALVALVEGV